MRRFADHSPTIERIEPSEASRPINLARESDFHLGRLLIRPSLREVTAGGRRQILEPRVMQVLVALARMDGRVISRDELIDSCWGGRIVGEDAINRCIGRLRRLAEIFRDSFSIETVSRVGYRLRDGDVDAGAAVLAFPRPARTVGLYAVLALVGASALILAGGLLAWRNLPQPRWTVERSQLLVSSAAIERHPAISPDGLTIAYSGGADEFTRQIYLRAIAGGEPMRLTNEPGDHTSSAWSPDGQRLAYLVMTRGQPCTVMVRPVHGGQARQIARCQSDERSQVVWSRSGDALFFTDRPSQTASERIVKLDLISGRRSDLTRPPPGSLGDRAIGLSPDGRWISFERGLSDLVAPLVVRDLSTGAERVLAKDWDMSPGGWTSDSRAVLAAGLINGDNVIWVYPIDGGRPSHLMSGPMEMGRLATGPHNIAALEVDNEVFNLASPPAVKGGPARVIDPSRALDGSPAIAPDGTLALAGVRSGEAGIWIKSPGGGFRQLLRVSSDAFLDGPTFSPDGTKLAFPTEVDGHLAIRILGVTGKDLGAVPFFGSQLGVPAWENGGRSLIFAGRDAGGWRLWRAASSPAGKPTPASAYGWLNVRSRGSELYGVRADSPGVWRIDGTPRLITRLPRPGFPNLWTIAGDAIDYVDDPFGHPAHVMSQPIAGGPPHVIAEAPGYAYDKSFAVSPITGAVVYAATRADSTDLELLQLGRG